MNKKQLAAKWANAGLTDDFIFSKVFLDSAITLELLRRVLPELQISQIKLVNSQQALMDTWDAKSVRFDIYAEDCQHNSYDIEMQVVNHHNLPQRNRFYQASLANASYTKGKNYNQANKSYVIFFCCFDPFGLGKQRYEISRRILEKPTFPYQDGERSLFFNILSREQQVGPKLQNFLNLLASRKVDSADEFIVNLEKRICIVKHNRDWRQDYMRRTLYEMDIEYERKQAIEQGLAKGMTEGIAKGMAKGRAEGLAEGQKKGQEEGRTQGIEQGKRQGRNQGINEERLALIRDLIASGQTQEQVEQFLVNVRKMSRQQAADYYLQATK